MIEFLHFHPITAAAIVVFLVALAKGGAPERLGCVLMVADWIAEMVADAYVGVLHIAVLPTLACDFLLALGLLILALRYGRLWLGFAMIMQSVVLALHAMALSQDAPGFMVYAATLNIITCLVLAALLTGALSAWRRRAATRRRASAAAPERRAAEPAISLLSA